MGHEATVLVRDGSSARGDEVLPTRGNPVSWNLAVLRRWRSFADADVVHIHGGIWASQIAYGLLRRATRDKVFIVHLHGSEARTGRGLHHLGWADAVVCATPDLPALVGGSTWIPNPVSLGEPPVPPSDSGPAVLGHFPTRRDLKGTAAIVEAFRASGPASEVRTWREDGIEKHGVGGVELWIVEGVPHDWAHDLMRRCDVVIDQFTPFGAYGMVSIEGMALGKVVMSSYEPAIYPVLPILRIAEQNRGSVFRDLLARREEWRRIGQRSREFAERVHGEGTVAGRHLRLYYESRSHEPWTRDRATRFWRDRGVRYRAEFDGRRPAGVAERFLAQEDGLRRALRGIEFRDFLEVGSGFGRITRLLLEFPGVRGTATDLSRHQLQAARAALGDPSVPTVQTSATALPFRNRSADLVIASEVLMHLPPEDMRSALAEMVRVARKYVVNLDWYEPYATGVAIPWCWNHDYPAAYHSLGLRERVLLPHERSLQRIFIAAR